MDRLKDMLAQDMDDQSNSGGASKAGKTSKGGEGSGGGSGSLFDLPKDVYGTPDGRLVVIAHSIKRALERASDVLEENIMNLDYEIVETGSHGFLGIGKKPYKLIVGRAFPGEEDDIDFKLVPEKGDFSEEPLAPVEPADRDGYVRVVVRKAGIFITAYPPKGKGKNPTMDQARKVLHEKSIMSFDEDLINGIVDEHSGEPVKIGEWHPNEQFDSKVSVEVSMDEMKAFARVTPPQKYGRVLEVEDVVAQLELKGVKYGILEDSINNMLDNEVYNTPVMAAKGKPVEYGKDAVIKYNFRKEEDEVNLKETDGRIDFFEKELVQNVVVGHLLATKEPATQGEAGRTVTNRRIETKPGQDVPLEAGKNTRLSDDGLEVISEINGQVVFKNNKINVEPILEIKGDASLESGNIVFLGTVIINGNVEDNVSVKAAGNVEVKGTVSKATIEAEGNVVVKRGILGKDQAVIKAGNDIMAKFVEHTHLNAGNDVVVMDAIMHSRADAGKRIIVMGKRAVIVGGRVRAREEVNAKEIGSRASTETVIEVGIDPKSREKLNALEEEKRESFERISNLDKDIITLQNQKSSGYLNEEKENLLQTSVQTKAELEERTKEINEEIEEIKAYLGVLEHKGKVCASKMVHPGTVIWIKNVKFPVKDNFKFVTFVLDGANVKVNPYEEVEDNKKSRGEKR